MAEQPELDGRLGDEEVLEPHDHIYTLDRTHTFSVEQRPYLLLLSSASITS